MPVHPPDSVRTQLDSVRPLVTLERHGLVLIALESAPIDVAPEYLTFDEASASGAATVHEVGHGVVQAASVVTSKQPVVIFGGDTIVGGKQHRIVNVTIWLPPTQTTRIPVSCLEQGRWDPGMETRFASGPRADLGLRSMVHAQVRESVVTRAGAEGAPSYASDQGAIWQEIGARQAYAADVSRTSALHDIYAREETDLEAFRRAFPYPEGASGVAVGLGGRIVALELFDDAAIAARSWRRVIDGAVRASLDHQRRIDAGARTRPKHRFPDRDALDRMLGRARSSLKQASATPSVGEGIDVRFGSDRITGAALVREDRVIHVEVHRIGG